MKEELKERLGQIKSEYLEGDVCMSELLASLSADGLSLEDAFYLYVAAQEWATGDLYMRYEYPSTRPVSILND